MVYSLESFTWIGNGAGVIQVLFGPVKMLRSAPHLAQVQCVHGEIRKSEPPRLSSFGGEVGFCAVGSGDWGVMTG